MEDTDSQQNVSDAVFPDTLDESRPLVMLNLLKFRGKAEYNSGVSISCSGYEAYQKYLENTLPIIDSLGGKVIYLGAIGELMAGEDSKNWDEVILVEYPNKDAISRLAASEKYQQGFHHRTAGLADTRVWITQKKKS